MNDAHPQPKLRMSALAVGGLLLAGIGALVLYGPGMIPLPDFPTLPSSEPQVDVVQLPEEFSKPVPRAVQQETAVTPPIAVQPAAIQQVGPPVLPPAPTPQVAAGSGNSPGWMAQLNPFAGLQQLKKEAATPQAPPTAPQAQATTKATPKRWAMLATPPEQVQPQAKGTEGEAQTDTEAPGPPKATDGTSSGQAGQPLIHPARWAIPEQPLRTIYRSQTLTGRLLQAVHSDIPGQVKIQLTTPVLDKFGYDTTILPKDTLIIAAQGGTPQFGNTRMELKLEQLELPSGEVIDLRATVGDAAGTNGMRGKVNNHLGKVILATGLSALLNIGVKTAVGTPDSGQFFRTPLQEAAQDVGASVQRDATSLIDKTLRIPPTITIPAGTFCTINLLENMQFHRPPHVAR